MKERGQLDNGFQIKVGAVLIPYSILLLIGIEMGFTLPAGIPEVAILIPYIIALFWWVPVLGLAALFHVYRQLS